MSETLYMRERERERKEKQKYRQGDSQTPKQVVTDAVQLYLYTHKPHPATSSDSPVVKRSRGSNPQTPFCREPGCS